MRSIILLLLTITAAQAAPFETMRLDGEVACATLEDRLKMDEGSKQVMELLNSGTCRGIKGLVFVDKTAKVNISTYACVRPENAPACRWIWTRD